MNEGKPTKPKWWNRPHRPGSAGDGDYELERPVSSGEGDSGEPGSDGDSDGDFELRSPHDVAAPEVSEVPDQSDQPDPDGSEGDFVLDRPAPAPVTHSDEAPAPQSTAERPKPLHDPDPYSTPPYGEPGPWAPAPPVQHPATTPPDGTAIPTQPPAPASAPVPAPVQQQANAQTQTQAQAQAMPAPAPAPAPQAPAPQAPAPVPGSPATTPPTTPWQNYDPWSSTPLHTPLQQNGAAVESKDKRRRWVRRALVGGAVALALVSGGAGGIIGAHLERNGGVGAVTLPQAGKEPKGRAPDSVAGIAARALPSVVTLHVSGAEESGTGTGFVLDAQGHILTNNHVVEPAADSTGRISVTFNSGDTAKASVVGRDSGYDLAVVKVGNVRGLKPMPLGNSDNVQVGDPVVAIGAPFDLEGTVTSGIISAKERPITAGGDGADGSDVSYVDALQTDAPINPGNSGGPLLDTAARVIGINSAIRSADDGSDSAGGQAGSIGLGFAIPVNQAKRVAEELINTGKATHPVIGVTLDMDYTGDGARVGTKAQGGGPAVAVGGPGAKAGLKSGDVITAVDGRRVHSGEELIVRTRAHRPGDRLELTVRRDGKERRISLVLGSADGS